MIERFRNGNRTPTINEGQRRGTLQASNTSRFFNSGIKRERDQFSGCVKLDTQQSLGELKVTRNQINLLRGQQSLEESRFAVAKDNQSDERSSIGGSFRGALSNGRLGGLNHSAAGFNHKQVAKNEKFKNEVVTKLSSEWKNIYRSLIAIDPN